MLLSAKLILCENKPRLSWINRRHRNSLPAFQVMFRNCRTRRQVDMLRIFTPNKISINSFHFWRICCCCCFQFPSKLPFLPTSAQKAKLLTHSCQNQLFQLEPSILAGWWLGNGLLSLLWNLTLNFWGGRWYVFAFSCLHNWFSVLFVWMQ